MTLCDWQGCTETDGLMLNLTVDEQGKGHITLLCPDHQEVYGLLYGGALRAMQKRFGIGSTPRPDSDLPEVLVKKAWEIAERLGIELP